MGGVFSTSIHGPRVSHSDHELKRNKTGCSNRQKEVSKTCILSLENGIEQEGILRSQAVLTLEYRPLNQTITAHVPHER